MVRGFACVTVIFGLEVLLLMDLGTCFNQLHGQIAELGLERAIADGLILQLRESHIVRFQCDLMVAWKAQRVMHRKMFHSLWPFMIVAVVSFCTQAGYSLRLLAGEQVHGWYSTSSTMRR